VAAVIKTNNRIFIGQRPENVHLAGEWEFPGGKVEQGETHSEALEREIMEELNLQISAGSLIAEEVHVYPGKHISLFFYHADVVSGEMMLNDHQDFAWVLPEELLGFRLAEGDRRFAEKYLVSGFPDFPESLPEGEL